METIIKLFCINGCHVIWSRISLAYQLGIADRQVRQYIRDARRAGYPIIALPSGGYKLAETQAEEAALQDMYLSYALDMLKTYWALRRMPLREQMTLEAFRGIVGGDAA